MEQVLYNNMTSVLNFANIDVSQISFSEPKVNARGGQTIWLSYNGQKIITQVPKGKCPFGLSKQQYDEGAPPKFDVSVSLGGTDKMNTFKEWALGLDKMIQESAVENSEKWFGKKKSAGVIEELYKPMILESKKGDYAPTMKFKMPFYDDQHTATVFDNERKEIGAEAITKGAEVILIAQISSMWFVGKQFGVTWQVLQAKVFPSSALPKYAFADDDDDDEEVNEDDYDEEEDEGAESE